MTSPLDLLLPYQRAWVTDQSRFKIGLWSRQTGKSFSTACEAVLDCVTKPGEQWVVLSAGERQALEWMRKAKQWTEAFEFELEVLELRDGEALLKQAEILFPNNSRIIAIPANPATARGYSANLILDEFAIHDNPSEIWAAIFPTITNAMSGEKKLRIVSTPKGRGNKFADLWEHNGGYSKHRVTIVDAVNQGLKADVDSLRASVDDPDIWAQEYMCEFIDSSSVLLPYELIGACESAVIADPGDVPLFVGMDVGRGHDLSVIVTLAKIGDFLHVVDVTELSRLPFREQLEIFVGKCSSPRVSHACVDCTGIGAMLAEEARRKCGRRVEPFLFTSTSKAELYTGMRRAFEERSVRIPVSNALREDLHAVQRLVSSGGAVTYSAPRSADGHSDRAAALALALRAAKSRGIFVAPFRIGS